MGSNWSAYVMEAVGVLWLIAVAGMFLSAITESSRPKPEAGEEKPGGMALLIAAIASLATPILLFLYAFWSIMSLEGRVLSADEVLEFAITQRIVVIGLFGCLAGTAIARSIIDWIIRAAAPGFGKALNVAAVPLAIATLALTIYVSHDAVSQFYDMATGPRP